MNECDYVKNLKFAIETASDRAGFKVCELTDGMLGFPFVRFWLRFNPKKLSQQPIKVTGNITKDPLGGNNCELFVWDPGRSEYGLKIFNKENHIDDENIQEAIFKKINLIMEMFE